MRGLLVAPKVIHQRVAVQPGAAHIKQAEAGQDESAWEKENKTVM